jgi:ribulose-5-phosphate 4-epimerase/fuculose-1-phosphate aldolase
MADEFEAERTKRKREVALGYRIFSSLRWGDLGDGHITARDPELPDHMWLLRFPCGFERATVHDLVLVRPDGSTTDGTEINMTAYNIHHPIHEARPDVIGVAHTHTPFGTPFSATGRPLEAITQEACTFHDRWAFFDDEEVQILNRNGGERIADALGDKQVGILRSHGLISTGDSVGETIAAFVTLERVTEALIKAPDAKPISDASAAVTRDDLVNYRSLELAFDFLVSRHIGDPSVVD